MIRISVAKILIFISLLSLTTSVVAQEALPARLADAAAQAEGEKKLILIEFFSYSSVASKVVKDRLLSSSQGQKLIDEKYVLVSVELERESALSERYGVTQVPVLVIARADGTEVDRIVGTPTPRDFASALEAAASGRSELAVLMEKVAGAENDLPTLVAVADAQAKRGMKAEALGHYNRYLDLVLNESSTTFDRNLRGVLSKMVKADFGGEGRASLQERRDQLAKAVAASGSERTARLVFVLNEALQENEQNADLYLLLPPTSPLRDRLFPAVFAQLVVKKAYAEAVGTIDLESLVNDAYPRNLKGAGAAACAHGCSPIQHRMHAASAGVQRQRVLEVTAAAVEALLATEQPEKAKRVAGRAVEFLNDDEVRERLAQAAVRAGDANGFSEWLKQLPKQHQAPVAAPAKS